MGLGCRQYAVKQIIYREKAHVIALVAINMMAKS